MTSRHRPAVYPANDFYGSELILRRHASWRRPIKAVIPHGVALNPYFTHDQITGWPVPYILPYSWLTKEWAAASAKHVVLSAAPFVYLVDRVEPVTDVARRPGPERRLLVFPAHSSVEHTSLPTSDRTMTRLEELRSDGWDCTVCVYWRDADLGRSVAFIDRGFRTVTCGHRNDQNFTARLVRLILEASAVAGDDLGSHMFYAAYLGRPYFSLSTPPQLRSGGLLAYYEQSPGPTWTRFRSEVPARMAAIYSDLADAFATTSTSPDADAQHAIAREFLGADNLLDPEHLRDVFSMAERVDRFDPHPEPGGSRSPLGKRQVRRAQRLIAPLQRQIRRISR